MIHCLVVDDEPIAREGLLEHIRQVDFLHPVAACRSAVEATSWLEKAPVDLLFLDIQMPVLTGLELVRTGAQLPPVIFTTAYPEYAIEGYELNVLDYLLKPIAFPRFLKAALKAQDYIAQQREKKEAPLSGPDDFFFIKCGQKIEKIQVAEVLYVEGMSNYVIVHTGHKKYVTYLTFKSIEEQLPHQVFVRIHKSFLVAIPAIRTINGNELLLEHTTLPISKHYKDAVMSRIEKRFFKR